MSFCENQWVHCLCKITSCVCQMSFAARQLLSYEISRSRHFKNYMLQICLQSNTKVERKQFEAPALYFLWALVWYWYIVKCERIQVQSEHTAEHSLTQTATPLKRKWSCLDMQKLYWGILFLCEKWNIVTIALRLSLCVVHFLLAVQQIALH